MKTCSACKEPKDASQFTKNRAQKDGLDNQCTICSRISKAKWKKLHPDRNAAQQRNVYAKNPTKGRTRINSWRKNNPSKSAAQSNRRNAARRLRTPKWLTELHYQQMNIFYDAAKKLTAEFGIKMEVDHIVPLQGKNVSGLHVPWNLQVMPKKLNASKGAR
jgi:hypothetical protein